MAKVTTRQVREAVAEHGSINRAASALGIARSTAQHHARRDADRARRRKFGHTVLAIGDLHAPFTHKHYLDFVNRVADQHQPDEVVLIGDVVDHHSISRHQTEAVAEGSKREHEDAMKSLKPWAKAFPVAKVCVGNHDAIPHRQAATVGMGPAYITKMNKLYELPETWTWAMEHEIDGVLYTHGTGQSGEYAHINLAKRRMQSLVMGHTHSSGGVHYIATPNTIIFGANTGCGIDPERYAFTYAKDTPRRPTLGCVVVQEGIEARFIPMRFKDRPIRREYYVPNSN